MEWLSAVVASIATIITAWFAYNQYTRNKMTDLKIEQFKQQEVQKSKRRSDNAAVIFGELWTVLHDLGACRVYIVQPHPLDNESMLSVYFEVKRKSVVGMREYIQGMRIAEVAKFSAAMAKNVWQYITDIDEQVDDRYAKSILSSHGTQSVIIKRLSDNNHDWVGSIFCEFTRPMIKSEDEAREILHTAALNIQYIIPPIEKDI